MRGKQVLINKLTHEMAILKRFKFAASNEAYSGELKRMLLEKIDADIDAITAEIELLAPTETANGGHKKQQPKRAPLPTSSPRKHMQRIGEALPRSRQCAWRRYSGAPCSMQVGGPAMRDVGTGAGAAAEHRQSDIHGRAGFANPDSTLKRWAGVCGVQLQPLADALSQELLVQQVLHADETPVPMLKPGNGKTHRVAFYQHKKAIKNLRQQGFQCCRNTLTQNRNYVSGSYINSWNRA